MNWDLGILKKSKFLIEQLSSWPTKGNSKLENSQQTSSLTSDDPLYGKDTLLEILQSEIIPSLVASKGKESCFSAGDEMSEYAPSAEQVYDFSMLCLNSDLSKAEAFVQDLLSSGKSAESVYLNLFAPAARQLGTLWEEDVCNFIQVTIGLVQIQTITRKLGNSFNERRTFGARGEKALFAPSPGSQHTFGALMVSEFFRKEGWQVWLELGPAESDLLTTIADEWFDVIGLSIGSDAELDDLSGLIGRIREASNNPSVFVMIGGAAIYGRTDLSNRFGADAFAADATSAVELARDLLATTA